MTSVQELFAIITAATSAKVMPTVIANLEAATGLPQVVTELHYEYGHQKELTATINRWAQDNALQNKNMPLIWLREDISFSMNGERRQVVIPSIVIAYITDITWTSKQREQYTFEPVLRPVYYELLRQISRNPNFVVYDPHTDIAHTRIERKYWGTDDDTKEVFTCPVDAIELTNVTITVDEDCLIDIN